MLLFMFDDIVLPSLKFITLYFKILAKYDKAALKERKTLASSSESEIHNVKTNKRKRIN